MKKHYIAPLFPSQSQQARLARKVRFAQGMRLLRDIHKDITSKKAQMIEREHLINSIAQ